MTGGDSTEHANTPYNSNDGADLTANTTRRDADADVKDDGQVSSAELDELMEQEAAVITSRRQTIRYLSAKAVEAIVAHNNNSSSNSNSRRQSDELESILLDTVTDLDELLTSTLESLEHVPTMHSFAAIRMIKQFNTNKLDWLNYLIISNKAVGFTKEDMMVHDSTIWPQAARSNGRTATNNRHTTTYTQARMDFLVGLDISYAASVLAIMAAELNKHLHQSLSSSSSSSPANNNNNLSVSDVNRMRVALFSLEDIVDHVVEYFEDTSSNNSHSSNNSNNCADLRERVITSLNELELLIGNFIAKIQQQQQPYERVSDANEDINDDTNSDVDGNDDDDSAKGSAAGSAAATTSIRDGLKLMSKRLNNLNSSS
jgi:hypothetical protein